MSLLDYLRKPSRTPRPWQSTSLPASVTRIKSMLSAEEKQYLCWLTAEQFEGWGAVVDLGPWLGSSSVALAEGLKRRGADTRIQSIDLFQWEPVYMESVSGAGLAHGQDFLPLFEQETAEYSAWIRPLKQDLTTFSWAGGPIEILFVDAAKSWELTNAIFRSFGPFLEPGKTRVVLQDFRYHETHFLPLIFDSRPDLWEEIESVDEGHTVTFLPLRPLTGPAGIQTDYSEDSFPLPVAERLLKNRIAVEEPSQRRWYARMLYRKHLIEGPPEETPRMREALLSEGGTSEADLASSENIEHILVPRGWKYYDLGDYSTAATIARQSIKISPGRQLHALSLLAFSLLQLGDRKAASARLQEILATDPSSVSARLGCAEIAVAEGHLEDAERGVLEVVSGTVCEKSTVSWALKLLEKIWQAAGPSASHLAKLQGLPDYAQSTPEFLELLAREQRAAGSNSDAMNTVEAALNVVTEEIAADRLRAEWHALADLQPVAPMEFAAGGLHRPQVPNRLPALAEVTLGELTSETLARAKGGDFGVSEEAILLALDLEGELEQALDLHNNRFSIRRYRDLFDSFFRYVGPPPPPLEGATIVDLGCGSLNPFGFLFLLLMLGARRGIAIDLETIHDWPRAAKSLAGVAADLLIAPARIVGEHPVRISRLLSNIESFDLAKLRAGDRTGIDPAKLVYRRESVHALSLQTAEADLIVSNAFFEHIPGVEAAIAELARVTRPGGMGVHVIDCTDHRRYHDPQVHPLQFLTESHEETLAHGSNRLRPAEFAKLFELKGFEVIKVESFQQATVPAEFRDRFVAPYRSMPEDMLVDTIVKLVVRRC
ncbi:MAG: tetratricopeptide repeat protein [Candidatus Solibacter sp.]